MFLHRRRFRDIRRSFRSSIYRAPRILFHSLTRSEEATSENSKRRHDGECSSYLFHSGTSLRLNRVLASESSRARDQFAASAITCHEFFSRSHLVVTGSCNDDACTARIGSGLRRAEDCPPYLSDADGRARHSVRAEQQLILPHKCNANCFADSPGDSYI